MFNDLIGESIKVYVDDIMVKGPKHEDYITNLAKAFDILQKYRMKLNQAEYKFGISSGRFLGYFVSQRGIEAHQREKKGHARHEVSVNDQGNTEPHQQSYGPQPFPISVNRQM